MSYYFATTLQMAFGDAIERVTAELAKEGFGIISHIDVRDILKKKLGIESRNYAILGACNPPYAFRAYQVDAHIGLLLPFNVILYEIEDGIVEVAAVDPEVTLQAAQNPALADISGPIRDRLRSVINRL